jgi:hypothetical protein
VKEWRRQTALARVVQPATLESGARKKNPWAITRKHSIADSSKALASRHSWGPVGMRNGYGVIIDVFATYRAPACPEKMGPR